MHKRYLLLAFVLVALSFTYESVANDLKPVKYKCEDGRIFTIKFVKQKGETIPTKANLVFSDSNKIEVLENQQSGSGICYMNGKYGYNEHHDEVSLTDFTKPIKNKMVYGTQCHEIK